MDPYAVLGLGMDADDAAIRARYLELVRQFPPEQVPQKAAVVRTAYEQLKDRSARLNHRLFEAGKDMTIESIIEDVSCRMPRRRFSLEELWSTMRHRP